MNRIIYILILFVFGQILHAQSDLEAHYTFDNCVVTDQQQVYADGVISGNPSCICGPSGDALSLDGLDDFVEFDTDLNGIFADDFSISFYFRIGSGTEPMDIISYRPSCAKDSSLAIRYIPAVSEIQVELAENFGDRALTRAVIDNESCWHWLVYTRTVDKYILYIDGVKVDEDDSDRQLVLHDTTSLRIANSPCIGQTDIRFNGELDELKLFSRALDETEIGLLNLQMDEILTNDTVIFLGSSLQINTGPTCSSSFTWTPITALDDPQSLDPVVSPTETTLYSISFNYPSCVVTDQIEVAVVDPDALECENLLLPNAFSPNNDGLNDDFGISNDFIVESMSSFEVFDKWGAVMFMSDNKADKWDGTFKGSPVDPGVFAYKIKYICSGQEFVKIGSVNVIR